MTEEQAKKLLETVEDEDIRMWIMVLFWKIEQLERIVGSVAEEHLKWN